MVQSLITAASEFLQTGSLAEFGFRSGLRGPPQTIDHYRQTRAISTSWLTALMIAAVSALGPSAAWAWGGEGHEVVGLIAERFPKPEVREAVEEMLAADTENKLTGHDLEQETKWADRARDENADGARLGTRNWHFVDVELGDPNPDSACYGHPGLQPGMDASRGPARDCILDKVTEFEAELRDPATARPERLAALKFLLHMVGDLHQPPHTADDHDRGGNANV